jgi:hypothetical protein
MLNTVKTPIYVYLTLTFITINIRLTQDKGHEATVMYRKLLSIKELEFNHHL